MSKPIVDIKSIERIGKEIATQPAPKLMSAEELARACAGVRK